MERFRGYLALTVVYLFILASVVYYFGRPKPVPIAIASPTPELKPSTAIVYVSGAVTRPGVYTMEQDARVVNAIEAAGGALEEADLADLNLAQRIYDEQHIHVLRKGEAGPAGIPSTNPGQVGDKIDINHASAQEVEKLPGIGPVLSQRIVAYRKENGRFANTDDIMKVSGIGPAIFEKIKDLIVAR